MGGKAFESDGLSTPRMPPSVYNQVLKDTRAKLLKIFASAESPIEGPGKTDHGDIDIIVVSQDPQKTPTQDEIAAVLGAYRWKKTPQSTTSHFAIPWPNEHQCIAVANSLHKTASNTTRPRESAPANIDELHKAAEKLHESLHSVDDVRASLESIHLPSEPVSRQVASPPTPYIQIDVHLCPSQQSMSWTLFHQAHGDLWSILGSSIRPLGFTVSSEALYLRIPEVEEHNRTLARVKLTDNPDQVLAYLELDHIRYWSPFSSWDEMMNYAASCRFHDPARRKTNEGDDELSRMNLNANDKARVGKRPSFAYWIDDYLPANRDNPPGRSSRLTREEMVQDAFRFFGPEFQERYETSKKQALQEIGQGQLWSSIRRQLPVEGVDVGYAMRGLKKEVVGDAVGKSEDTLTPVQKAYLDQDFETVKLYALKNWQEIGERYKMFVNQTMCSNPAAQEARSYSAKGTESYTEEDNDKIIEMKRAGKSWSEILSAIGKKSRSQIQAHWKNTLQTRGKTEQDVNTPVLGDPEFLEG